MKYNIISINDERWKYKNKIRAYAEIPEVRIQSFNAHEMDLRSGLRLRNIEINNWGPKIGELGVWLSNFDCWDTVGMMDEPLVVFEDDAIIDPHFFFKASGILEDLPDDWDFCALWVPENQRQDFTYEVTYDHQGDPIITGHRDYEDSLFWHTKRVARVYQGYGMVSLMYSPSGGKKLVDLAREYGIYTPVDCFVYQQAHMGNLNGFAPTPMYANIVSYDWSAQSHVQQTEKVEL